MGSGAYAPDLDIVEDNFDDDENHTLVQSNPTYHGNMYREDHANILTFRIRIIAGSDETDGAKTPCMKTLQRTAST